MKKPLTTHSKFLSVLESQKTVYIFGSGISMALTSKPFNWFKWIESGLDYIKDKTFCSKIKNELYPASGKELSAEELVVIVGKIITQCKKEGSYDDWMTAAFEGNDIVNLELAKTLRLIKANKDIVATTNYDSILEKALSLAPVSYNSPDIIFKMLESGIGNKVIHLHGIYNSGKESGTYQDDIIATKEQYDNIYNDDGAQFIQNLLGTKSLIFIGCGKTTDDINISRFIHFACDKLHIDVPYFYLKCSKEEAPKLPSNFTIIDYGDEYNDLPLFLNEMLTYRIRSFYAKNPLVGRTIYSETKILGDYYYANEQIKFIGRKVELNMLSAFAKIERQICWYAITGQGGAGKSRLAFEFMRRMDRDFFCFFMNGKASNVDVDKFSPFCDTLIIFDYVQGREKNIADQIHSLFFIFKQTKFKLRILFLERENETSTGSWFNKLNNSIGKLDSNEFSSSQFLVPFLNLQDLDEDSVCEFIGEVRALHNLPPDSWQDKRLKDEYKKKYEHLRFRPLYVQLYVEAWIDNKCTTPSYDAFSRILENAVLKEQSRWVEILGGNKELLGHFIRILVRATVSDGIDFNSPPEAYIKDCNALRSYFNNTTIPGKQRVENIKNILADLAQNICKKDYVFKLYYPDIIQEYMFSYYTDSGDFDDVCTELWKNEPEKFSVFIQRGLMDFADEEKFFNALEFAPNIYTNIEALKARLGRIHYKNLGDIKSKSEAENIKQKELDLINKEYKFWHNMPLNESDYDILSVLKTRGLDKCAEGYGGWYLLDDVMKCLEEMASIKGLACAFLKTIAFENYMNSFGMAGLHDLAKRASYLRGEALKEIVADDDKKDLDSYVAMTRLQDSNIKMMSQLMKGNVYDAGVALRQAEKNTDFTDIEQVRFLSGNAERFVYFVCGNCFISSPREIVKCVERACNVIEDCLEKFPNDKIIKHNFYTAEVSRIQIERIIGLSTIEISKKDVERLLDDIIQSDCDNDGMATSSCSVLLLKYLDLSKPEDIETAEKMIKTLEELINRGCVDATQGWLICQRAIYETRKEDVPFDIVQKGFAYYLRNTGSESTRGAFFDLLEKSVERKNTKNYLTPQIKDSFSQDIMYNPIASERAAMQLSRIFGI